MDYTQINDDYRYDTIADAIYAREVEHFHYNFDRVNFLYILTRGGQDETFIAEVAERMQSTIVQMKKVAVMTDALRAQIEDPAAYDRAVQRVTEKRASANKNSK
jgi:hypothetical protein